MTKHCRKPSHLGTKIKSLIVIQIQEALWRNLNNLKPSFSRIKSFTFQREVKEERSCFRGQIMPTRNNNKPRKTNMRATTSQYEMAKITFVQSKPLHFFPNISNSLLSIVNIKPISERRQLLFFT